MVSGKRAVAGYFAAPAKGKYVPEAGGCAYKKDRRKVIWSMDTKYFQNGEICILCLCTLSDLRTPSERAGGI